MSKPFDAIVIGARCAGASAAMLLARSGHRVLLLDRAAFPSDTVSTLLIQPQGVAALERWGLLDPLVASGCPPIEQYAFDPGPVVVTGQPLPTEGWRTAYAPRRIVLDQLLVDAAVEAGVEFRDQFTVDEVIVEDSVVVGVRGRDVNGQSVVERAQVVVGADGHNSRVARSVGAETYDELPVLANSFYTFWSDLPVDGVHIRLRDDRAIASMPTHDGLTLVLVGLPADQGPMFKGDVEGNYMKALERDPELADGVRTATREARFAGGGVPNFMRKPYGPGWALVGDAGCTKDPVTAQGISDAFKDAEQCASALSKVFGGDPFESTMSDFHHTRDARIKPIYEVTTHLASFEPPPEAMLGMLASLQGNQGAMDAFLSVIAGTSTPDKFFETAQQLLGQPEMAPIEVPKIAAEKMREKVSQ